MTLSKININGDKTVSSQLSDDTVLLAALRSGVGFPYECNAGACGSCKYELLCGDVESLMDSPPGLTARDVRKNIYLGCQTRPQTDISIKARLSDEYIPVVTTKKYRLDFLIHLKLHMIFVSLFFCQTTKSPLNLVNML